jgi:hypothetical protein
LPQAEVLKTKHLIAEVKDGHAVPFVTPNYFAPCDGFRAGIGSVKIGEMFPGERFVMTEMGVRLCHDI